MPASRCTPSSTLAASPPRHRGRSRRRRSSRRRRATSPVAPFSRSCSACALAVDRIGMVDARHHLPGRPARGRRSAGAARARVERLDRDAVIGRGDEPLLERRALQHALHELQPLVARGRRKFGGEREIVGHRPKMPRSRRTANVPDVEASKLRARGLDVVPGADVPPSGQAYSCRSLFPFFHCSWGWGSGRIDCIGRLPEAANSKKRCNACQQIIAVALCRIECGKFRPVLVFVFHDDHVLVDAAGHFRINQSN